MSGALLPPIVPKEIPAHVIAAVGLEARIRNALERVECAAREARRRQRAWYAMRSDRNLYAAKAAERDLDKAIKALDDLRAAEHEARVQPRLPI